MFLYLETYVSWESRFRCYAVYELYQRYVFQFRLYLISEGRRNCSTLWPVQPYSNGTMTPRKHVIKYKNMRKWMDEFRRKFENRDIKIARVNSILITRSINFVIYFNFVRCLGCAMLTAFYLRRSSPLMENNINSCQVHRNYLHNLHIYVNKALPSNVCVITTPKWLSQESGASSKSFFKISAFPEYGIVYGRLSHPNSSVLSLELWSQPVKSSKLDWVDEKVNY